MLKDVEELYCYVTGSSSAATSQPPAPSEAVDSSIMEALYHALGGWFIEAPNKQQQQRCKEHDRNDLSNQQQEPLLDNKDGSEGYDGADPAMQVLGNASYWGLRAAMLNCLPVAACTSPELDNTNHHHLGTTSAVAAAAEEGSSIKPAAERNSISSTAARAPAAVAGELAGHTAAHSSEGVTCRVECESDGDADALKGANHPDTPSKQYQPGAASSLKHSSSSHCLDQQPRPAGRGAATMAAAAAAATSTSSATAAAAAAAAHSSVSDGALSSSSGVVGPETVLRLRLEMKLMAAHLAELTTTCSRLEEENMRLRSAGDVAGDDGLLTDAVQQLLREKSALQQEVGRLNRQNEALQELLEYTAAAAGAQDSSDSECSDAGSTSSSPAGTAPHHLAPQQAPAAAAADSQPQVWQLVTPAVSPNASSSTNGGVARRRQSQQQQQQQLVLEAPQLVAIDEAVSRARSAATTAEAGAAAVTATSACSAAAQATATVAAAAAAGEQLLILPQSASAMWNDAFWDEDGEDEGQSIQSKAR